ncbi:MAG: hypothetical protein Q7K41_00055, partial [Dehalococcoidales bacterium]|nr:hypothetical protein [Dehalococcoidales bacterium]
LSTLDFEGKRQALDMLGITVWLDGEAVEVTGVIDTEGAIVTTPSFNILPPPLEERGWRLIRNLGDIADS